MSDSDNTLPPSSTTLSESERPSAAPVTVGPSWHEQDLVLRDMWTQNKTPQDIAEALGRSVAAIMTRAARLGLPRRSAPGRKPGSRRPMQESGHQRASTPRHNMYASSDHEAAPQASTRICLMCLRSFQSQGRHNRICPTCKGSSEYSSAVSLADINFPI